MQGTSLAGLYNFTISFIEILSLLALIATFVFLSRRNLIKLPRFNMAELKGWPMKDANFILLGEIFLVTCIFTMNSADFALQARGNEHYHFTGNFVYRKILLPFGQAAAIQASFYSSDWAGGDISSGYSDSWFTCLFPNIYISSWHFQTPIFQGLRLRAISLICLKSPVKSSI